MNIHTRQDVCLFKRIVRISDGASIVIMIMSIIITVAGVVVIVCFFFRCYHLT
jgi:hypothetical protein